MFYLSLLQQDTTKKGRVEQLASRLEFEYNGHSKESKVEPIWNNAIYT